MLRIAILTFCSMACVREAHSTLAQQHPHYPSRPIRAVVPFPGGGPMNVAGRVVQLMFFATSFLGLIREGRLRALAVTLPRRSPLRPDVPTLEEAGIPAIPLQVWSALFTPARTPEAIIARLSRELSAVLRSSDARALHREGIAPQEMSPLQLATHVKSQYNIWGRAIREAGIPLE